MKPIISVVVVTYNHEDEISNCIQSLVQHLPSQPSEIFVIDNYSIDNTIPELEKLKSQFKTDRVSFFLKKNKLNLGYTKAMNQGLIKASGRFLLLLNPDTEITAKSIGSLIQFLSNHPDAGAVAPQLRYPDGNIQFSCRRFPKYRHIFFEIFALHRLFSKSKFFNGWKMGDFDHQALQIVDQPQGACLLVRRDVLEDVGELDERFYMFFSDVDLCRRIQNSGYKIYFYPGVQIYHAKGSSVYARRSKMIWQSHKDFVRYFLKWYRSLSLWIWNIFGIPMLLFVGILRWSFFLSKEWLPKKRHLFKKETDPVKEMN